MKTIKHKANLILIAVISIHVLVLAYFLIFKQYFQQDEWHSFGLILALKENYITLYHSIFELLLGDRVGARAINYELFSVFGINSIGYGIAGFTYHIVNTLLIYLVSFRLTKQSVISFLSALFFLVNEVGSEAYSWFGTMNGSATSVLFFLLSFLLFLNYLNNKKYINILLSLLLLWISFLLKEITIFAFLLYPLVFLINTKKDKWRTFFKTLGPFLIFAIIMLLFMAKTVLFIQGDRANYIGADKSFIPNIILHGVQYPLEGVVQVFFPNSVIFMISGPLTRIFNPSLIPETSEFDIAAQNTNAELTVIFLLLMFAIIIYLYLRKIWKDINSEIKKTLFISMAIIIFSFIPYIVLNRSFAFLDSRHYYSATIGASIFLATFLYIIYRFNKKRWKILSLLIIVAYIFIHEIILFSDFKLQTERADERKLFIEQVLNIMPNLNKKTVFFISGNSPGYYGLPDLKVPFQSGAGQVLMVIYTQKKQLDPVFFKEKTLTQTYDAGFLYDILGQGYREVNGKGFGYYYEKNELDKALNKKLFNKDDVVYLYYDSEEQTLNRLVYK